MMMMMFMHILKFKATPNFLNISICLVVVFKAQDKDQKGDEVNTNNYHLPY